MSNGIEDTHPEKWRRIRDYENLHAYLRDLYQTDGIADTVNMAHIVEHYASPGSPQLDTPDPEDIDMRLDEPHNRDELPTVPLEA